MKLAAYCLAAGFVALVTGAAVSLAAHGTARVVVWCTVAGVVSVAAGCVYRDRT